MAGVIRKLIFGAGFILYAGTGLFGRREEVRSEARPLVPEVQVITARSQTVPDEPEFVGQTESSRPVEIRSQVTGILKELFFQEGGEVKKDDRLYRIDPIPFEAAYVGARARVAQAEARLVQARQNLVRVKPLSDEQGVSQKDVDDAVAEDLAVKAALQAATGDLVKAKFDLDNTLIIAPISGMIERTRFYEGRLVTAQSELLTVIHNVDPMYVTVNPPETFLLKQRRDIAAKKIHHPGTYDVRGVIQFADGTTYDQEGVLDFLDVGLRTETGSRPARLTFPNEKRILIPGQFVTVRFKGALKTGAIVVPKRSVQQSPKGPIIFVVGEGEKVEMRAVEATVWQGTEWIIGEGLHVGERVIVDGSHRVAPGTVVKAVELGESGTDAAAPQITPGATVVLPAQANRLGSGSPRG